MEMGARVVVEVEAGAGEGLFTRLLLMKGGPEEERSRLIVIMVGGDSGSTRGEEGERMISCLVVVIGGRDGRTLEGRVAGRDGGEGPRDDVAVFRPRRRGWAEPECSGSNVVVAIGTC
jgi:hypothetical protein